MILGPALQPVYKKYLPHWIFDRLEICAHGWEYRNKRAYHDRLGDVFVLSRPTSLQSGKQIEAVERVRSDETRIAQATIALSMLQRRNDFPQAPIVAKLMGFLGSNAFCANGEEWKRHRRMFASNLDERINRAVWTESKVQAQDMFKYIVNNPGNQTLDSLKSLAINVIRQAGFSQKEDWTPGLRGRLGAATTGRAAYIETLSLITEMFIEAALLPTKFMKLPTMSSGLQPLGYHMQRTAGYVQEVLNEERKATQKASGPRSNFLGLLLQLSDEDRRSGQSQLRTNTMGYSVSVLAAYPEWQECIREELQGLSKDPSTWKYEEVFPKCRRTLALMLETLHLFPPVLHTTRAVLEPQKLTDATGKTHLLTPPMDIYACQLSIHLDRRIWGDDADEFKPSRWIDESGQLITPEKGTYLPWSGGPRICTGMKMSQVEFVAAMATLFLNGKCEPLPADGVDSPQLLRERLLGLTRDSVWKISLSMRNPDAVQLRWTAV
ncbi:hypothetical protein AnigIFM60653_008974 [Aspergillus niger]|nr:hypothetical protein AnigIFM60653_008974 [Aspergillus niger]